MYAMQTTHLTVPIFTSSAHLNVYCIVRIVSPWVISLHQLWTGGGLRIRTELIYVLPYTSVLYLYKNITLKREVGL